MSLRYGLVDGTPWTLQAIAEVLGISRERVRQIEMRIIRKLKYKRSTSKPGSAEGQLRQYLYEAIRPGEPGDLDRLAIFVQEDLAHKLNNTQVMPLLDIFSTWLRASGTHFSEHDLVKRIGERLVEQQAALLREIKRERNRAALRACLDAFVIWPNRCCMVDLPLYLVRQREVNPDSQGQTGVFVSEKLGRSVQYESQMEQRFLMRLEQSTDVVYYQEQPFRIPYSVEGHNRVYIPDVFFVMADGRSVVVEIKPKHQIVLSENLRKWPVLRDFCEEKGYGRLVTDGRVGIKSFWEHPVPQAYSDRLLAVLADGPLTWPQYNTICNQYSPSWNDFIALVLQYQLVWSMHPFRLSLASPLKEKRRAYAE